MPRKTRKQKIAYQKRLEKENIKPEEMQKRHEADKKLDGYHNTAVKLSIVEYEGDFYADVITTYLVKDGFLGFKRYEKISQIGTFYDKTIKSKEHIDDTINLLKKELSTISKGYVFFEFFNTSQEFKLKIISSLEDILCRAPDEKKAKFTLPSEECPEKYNTDIIARRYVNDM